MKKKSASLFVRSMFYVRCSIFEMGFLSVFSLSFFLHLFHSVCLARLLPLLVVLSLSVFFSHSVYFLFVRFGAARNEKHLYIVGTSHFVMGFFVQVRCRCCRCCHLRCFLRRLRHMTDVVVVVVIYSTNIYYYRNNG